MRSPEELYQRLAAAVQQTLLTSESVEDTISDISGAGYSIRLDVWAQGTSTLFDILSDEDSELDLFSNEAGSQGEARFAWLPTTEDSDVLRWIGIF